MLSILIPTYQYDCSRLVSDLHLQAQQLGVPYEIIVADDASPDATYRESHSTFAHLPHCRLIQLSDNVGRARIRNLLAHEASYDWLLFMDADAQVISPTYLADYISHADKGADVICGGLCHAPALPSPEVSLRYAYEHRADKRRAAHYRRQHPYERFTPFNFMVRRTTFLDILFCEAITDYGHEDTLFGIALAERHVPIAHIDNPLLHLGLEPNEVFLSKTRAALRNLAAMQTTLEGHSSLISAYRLLSRLGISHLIARCYTRHENTLATHLCGPHPCLTLFFLYKLGYYCHLLLND